MKTNMPQIKKAFTLIELLVVLAILAILVGSVVLSFKAPLQSARLETTVERMILMDRQLRDHARRFARPAEMRINLTDGIVIGTEPKKRETIIPAFSPGDNVRIDQVAFGKHRIDSGIAEIDFSVRGRTPTYAVRLCGGSDKRQWLVFLGRTGQIVRIENEKEIDAFFQMLQSQRTDAS